MGAQPRTELRHGREFATLRPLEDGLLYTDADIGIRQNAQALSRLASMVPSTNAGVRVQQFVEPALASGLGR